MQLKMYTFGVRHAHPPPAPPSKKNPNLQHQHHRIDKIEIMLYWMTNPSKRDRYFADTRFLSFKSAHVSF